MSPKGPPGAYFPDNRAMNRSAQAAGLALCAGALALLAMLAASRAPAGTADAELRRAAAEGDAARTAALLEQGADPNSVDPDGVTPLMIAVVGDPDRIRGLIRKGIAGDWHNHFTEEDKALYKELTGSLLVDLGYEESNDW